MVTQRIAIIPARGGSKRIPDKNIIDFCGKPMIAWTIEAAHKSKLFHRVLVSTDDARVANVSKEFGAEAPFLREGFSDDFSPVSEATASALKQAMNYWGEEYGSVVQLMANCPLRTSQEIKDAVLHFEGANRAYQISCFRYGWMNPWWAVELGENFAPRKLFPETENKRSQDLPELFCPTGAIWIAKAEQLLGTRSFYAPGHVFQPMRWERAVDIDDYDDLLFAKALYQQLEGSL